MALQLIYQGDNSAQTLVIRWRVPLPLMLDLDVNQFPKILL